MTGAPREPRMPGLCANCGAAAVTLWNAEFAEEFGRLNADKVWVRSGARARRAHRLRWVAFALVLAAGVAVIVLDAMGKLPD